MDVTRREGWRCSGEKGRNDDSSHLWWRSRGGRGQWVLMYVLFKRTLENSGMEADSARVFVFEDVKGVHVIIVDDDATQEFQPFSQLRSISFG